MSEHLIPCSVQVLTRNNGKTLRACLETLRPFAEVIIQDGRSTDDTKAIAREFSNVTFLDQNDTVLDDEGRIKDFSAVRNASIQAARYDWVLVVDADEGIKQDLTEEVRSLIQSDKKGVYVAFRRYYVNGEKVMHSTQYPALQIRFFHRDLIIGYEKPVHERIKMKDGITTQMLQSELPVPLPPARQLRAKYHRYLLMEAKRAQGITVRGWLKWVLWRNTRTMVGLLLRLLNIWLVPRAGKRLPLSYEAQFLAHSFKTIFYTMPKTLKQFATYVVMGSTATIIDIGSYWILLWLGVYFVTASVIGGVLGFLSAFLLHKYVAFKKYDKIAHHFVRFCLLGLWNLFATNVILYVCVRYIGIPDEYAKIVANASVVLWNFFLYKFVVYI